jgi:hypothetical protein
MKSESKGLNCVGGARSECAHALIFEVRRTGVVGPAAKAFVGRDGFLCPACGFSLQRHTKSVFGARRKCRGLLNSRVKVDQKLVS